MVVLFVVVVLVVVVDSAVAVGEGWRLVLLGTAGPAAPSASGTGLRRTLCWDSHATDNCDVADELLIRSLAEDVMELTAAVRFGDDDDDGDEDD